MLNCTHISVHQSEDTLIEAQAESLDHLSQAAQIKIAEQGHQDFGH